MYLISLLINSYLFLRKINWQNPFFLNRLNTYIIIYNALSSARKIIIKNTRNIFSYNLNRNYFSLIQLIYSVIVLYYIFLDVGVLPFLLNICNLFLRLVCIDVPCIILNKPITLILQYKLISQYLFSFENINAYPRTRSRNISGVLYLLKYISQTDSVICLTRTYF